jgi:hypothetical protein
MSIHAIGGEANSRARKLAGDRAGNIFGAIFMVLMAVLVIGLALEGIYNNMGQDDLFLGLLIGLGVGSVVAAAPALVYYAYAVWDFPPED